MADESQTKDLLSTLTGSRLPALPDAREPEPREPSESTEDREITGRTPEDVVQAREQPPTLTETEPDETALPAAPKKDKRKPEAKTYELDGVKYTMAELESKGLLEKVIQTARQFPSLQKKYVEALEEGKKAAPAKTEEAPAEPPAITNLMIAKTYDDIAQTIINDLLNNKLLSEDFVELYGRDIKTCIGQQRYAFDELFQQKAMLNKAIERLEATIAYLNQNKAETEGNLVAGQYNKHLNSLVEKDPKLYAGLKNQQIRDNFTKYLLEELGATREQITNDRAPVFLGKQWVAFNAQVIMDAAKNGIKEKGQKADKRFVIGEGTGSRPATPEEAPELLDRLIDRSGRIRE